MQQGISLLTVMIILLLAALLLLGASRTTIFNEFFTHNQSNYQRTYQAAQMLLANAKQDIQSLRIDGTVCPRGTTNCRPNFAFPTGGSGTGCTNTPDVSLPSSRPLSTTQAPTECIKSPKNQEIVLRSRLPADNTIAQCAQGVCVPLPGDWLQFWNTPAQLTTMIPLGARYGQFTGGAPTSNQQNSILTATGDDNPVQARYWIEVLPCDNVGIGIGGPNATPFGDGSLTCTDFNGLYYRITAYAADGRGSVAIVQDIIGY